MQFTDQINETITLQSYPKRIVSLVPSQTELLYELGLEEEVVGITKFCIHPTKWFRTKNRIGGTKNVDIAKVQSLQPDLVIANKEENTKADIEALKKFVPVWVSDICDLPDALEMIENIGIITNRENTAHNLKQSINEAFNQLPVPPNTLNTAYLIWRNPYITIGRDTFIHDMLKRVGFNNVFEQFTRYPEISLEQLKAANCNTVMLSSEPYPFKEKHIEELQSQLPDVRIQLVDGEMFSWYGSRLLQSTRYFKELMTILHKID